MPEEKENKVRPVACGRKNYLFCGNHDAAEDAAVLYSFFGAVNLPVWTSVHG